jgi:CheY-like chemotaxis protein
MRGLARPANKKQADFRDLFRVAAMSDATSTVLVIDDDPDLRASVGRLLRSLGINVQLFASISDFLKSDPADCPTCLVLYIRLPGQSGSIFSASLPQQTGKSRSFSVLAALFALLVGAMVLTYFGSGLATRVDVAALGYVALCLSLCLNVAVSWSARRI